MDYPKNDPNALLHNDKFTDGDPTLGIPPSPDSAQYQNMVFDELLNVIAMGSQQPSVNDRTQIAATLAELLGQKAAASHTHTIAQVQSLRSELDQLWSMFNSSTPVGAMMPMAFTQDTDSWLLLDGRQNLSRVTYSQLFAVIGTRFGAGDGINTFGIDDMRAEYLFGLDMGRGIDAGRELGEWKAGQVGSHTHKWADGWNYDGSQSGNLAPGNAKPVIDNDNIGAYQNMNTWANSAPLMSGENLVRAKAYPWFIKCK